MLLAILNKSWKQHPTKQQFYGHLPPILQAIEDELHMMVTAGEIMTNLWATFSNGLLHIDTPVLADQ